MRARFEIRTRSDGRYEAAYIATNGTRVMTTIPFDDRAGLMMAIHSIRDAGDAEIVDTCEDGRKS